MTTYYVDATGGNDGNLGTTPGTAWKTLSKIYSEFAAATFAGGDSILFKRGETWVPGGTARIRIRNVAGTSLTAPLYIGAYDSGAIPSIDGGGGTGVYLVESGNLDAAVDYVVVEDIEFAGNLATHIFMEDVFAWQVRGCTMGTSGGVGVTIRGTSEWVVINGCTIPAGNEGIYVGKFDGSDNPKRIIITYNNISNTDNDGIDFKPGCEWCVAAYNTVYDCSQEGITIRGNHILVKGNIVYGCNDVGIAHYDGAGSYATVEFNLVYTNTGNNYGIRIQSPNSIVRNNTIYDCVRGILVTDDGNTMTIRNNIMDSCTFGLRVNAGAGTPDSDYNDYFNSVTSDLYLADDGGNRTIVWACANLGIECNSVTVDPQFVDYIDFEITTLSNAYAAGDISGDQEFDGIAPSQGYWEPDYGLPHWCRTDGLETVDFSRWTSSTTDGGDLAPSTSNPYAGNWVARFYVDDLNAMYLEKDDLDDQGWCNVRIWFDPNSLTFGGGGDEWPLIRIMDGGANVAVLRFGWDGANYYVKGRAVDDFGGNTDTAAITISDAYHSLELQSFVATAIGENNGHLAVLVDSVRVAEVTTVNNDTRAIDTVQVGAIAGLDAGLSGAFYIDEIIIGTDGTEILGVTTGQSPGPAGGGAPTKLYHYRRRRTT